MLYHIKKHLLNTYLDLTNISMVQWTEHTIHRYFNFTIYCNGKFI